MHPVEIALPSEADPSFFFPELPPLFIFRLCEYGLITTPLEFVPVWVEIHCNAPAVHRPAGAAADWSFVITASPEIKVQALNLIYSVMVQDIIEHPEYAVMDLLVTGKGMD